MFYRRWARSYTTSTHFHHRRPSPLFFHATDAYNEPKRRFIVVGLVLTLPAPIFTTAAHHHPLYTQWTYITSPNDIFSSLGSFLRYQHPFHHRRPSPPFFHATDTYNVPKRRFISSLGSFLHYQHPFSPPTPIFTLLSPTLETTDDEQRIGSIYRYVIYIYTSF
jgi:hypothetical protein